MRSNEVTASDIKRLMLRNYRRYSNGEIDEAKAYKENIILANILKAFEASETEERLIAIENALRTTTNDNYDDEEE